MYLLLYQLVVPSPIEACWPSVLYLLFPMAGMLLQTAVAVLVRGVRRYRPICKRAHHCTGGLGFNTRLSNNKVPFLILVDNGPFGVVHPLVPSPVLWARRIDSPTSHVPLLGVLECRYIMDVGTADYDMIPAPFSATWLLVVHLHHVVTNDAHPLQTGCFHCNQL